MALDLLVITASSGKNLELAERFAASGQAHGLHAQVLDLTTLPLPLYNPRQAVSNGLPEGLTALSVLLASAPRWVICAPEYNGSIPPLLTNAIAWLSVQGDDFRQLFNGRPIVIATHSGGGGFTILTALRLQLAHLGAHVVGRQLISTNNRLASDASIDDLVARLEQLTPIATDS
jgi:NAD(P)H-dependent FMN reductase